MEKALVTAELSTEQAYLTSLQRNVDTLQSKIYRTEAQRTANRIQQENEQSKLKNTMQSKKRQINK